jgi:multidrug efflux pump subunit AcrA (membrane-fusion protein)
MKISMSRARTVVTARPWISACAVAFVVGSSIAAYVLTGDSNAQAQDGVTTRLVSVTNGTVRQTVSTTGTISPADEQDVSFASAAEITSVRVEVGDKVRKGQVLGTIDTLSLRAALADARSTLAAAEASLATAEDSGTSTDAQLDADRAAVSTARGGVAAAKDALRSATLRSPITGTVAEVNVAVGDQASGSGGTSNPNGSSDDSSGDSAGDFVVVGMKKWTVAASVDDTQVGLIKKGQQAQITTGNVSGMVFGVVSSVSVLSSSTSGSATYPVQIEITGNPRGLHDGADASVEIIYKQVSNVLTVPSAAVHLADGTSYVYVSANGKKVRTTVTTGMSAGGTTEIKSGLREGQQVYVDVVTGLQRNGTSDGANTDLQNGPGVYPGGVVPPADGNQVFAPGNAPVDGTGGGK